jgi:hypothetical protein
MEETDMCVPRFEHSGFRSWTRAASLHAVVIQDRGHELQNY